MSLLKNSKLGDMMTADENFKMIRLTDIKEDPDQPRKYFDEITLNELAETIEIHGVKTPISVHVDPDNKEKYIINHGARRFRAAVLAGLNVIPAMIDNSYTSYDQVIENLQRDNLKSIEIAIWIGKLLKSGAKKNEIAKAIGKSNSYVTQHVNLLTLPPCIKEAFENERTQDVTLLNDLATLYAKHPEEVADWLADTNEEINRSAVKYLRSYVENIGVNEEHISESDSDQFIGNNISDNENTEISDHQLSKAPSRAVLNVIVYDKTSGREGVLNLKKPTAKGFCFVQLFDEEVEIETSKLEIISIA